jgi:hypothetical protein
MSLPLTRRIARTALLVAAGAAPLIGAAGAASAADLGAELPTTATMGEMSSLDTGKLGKAADATSQKVGNAAGETGGRAVEQALPAAGKTVGTTARKAAGDTLPGGLRTDRLPVRALPGAAG